MADLPTIWIFKGFTNLHILFLSATYVLGTSAYEAYSSAETLKKQKFFLENKENIVKGLNEINILDVDNFSKKQLEEYANRGRSKVLR